FRSYAPITHRSSDPSRSMASVSAPAARLAPRTWRRARARAANSGRTRAPRAAPTGAPRPQTARAGTRSRKIDASGMERLAAEQPRGASRATAPEAVLEQGHARVLGAGRREPAGPRQQRRAP